MEGFREGIPRAVVALSHLAPGEGRAWNHLHGVAIAAVRAWIHVDRFCAVPSLLSLTIGLRRISLGEDCHGGVLGDDVVPNGLATMLESFQHDPGQPSYQSRTFPNFPPFPSSPPFAC